MGAIQAVRQRTYRALDELSPEGLEERTRFLEFLGFRNRAENPGVALDGLKKAFFICGGGSRPADKQSFFGAAEAAGGPIAEGCGRKAKVEGGGWGWGEATACATPKIVFISRERRRFCQ